VFWRYILSKYIIVYNSINKYKYTYGILLVFFEHTRNEFVMYLSHK